LTVADNDFDFGYGELMVDVSIIMPCFNSSKYLDESVRSVLNQSYKSWELIICDDGSTDSSMQIAEKWARRYEKIYSLRNKFEKGAAGARNTCLSVARGRYIAFLDADDIWLPFKLERQINFMADKKHPFVFGYCENISEQGDLISTTISPAVVSFRKLLLSNFIPCLTVIYDSKVLGKVYQPYIKKRNDFALWLRILGDHQDVKAFCYPETIARYRVNSYGLSANKLSGIKYFYRCLRQYGGLGVGAAGFYTFSAIGFKALKTVSPQLYNFVVTKIL